MPMPFHLMMYPVVRLVPNVAILRSALEPYPNTIKPDCDGQQSTQENRIL